MFRVLWEEDAVQELFLVWTRADASTRQSITAAARELDRLLSDDPVNQGEGRGESERITFVAPLGVTFAIDSQKQIVHILQVWWFRQRG